MGNLRRSLSHRWSYRLAAQPLDLGNRIPQPGPVACVPSSHRPAVCPACLFPSAPLPECPASPSNVCLRSCPKAPCLRTSLLSRPHRAPPPSPSYIIIISHMREQTRGQVPSAGTGNRRQVSCARSHGPPQARPGLTGTAQCAWPAAALTRR